MWGTHKKVADVPAWSEVAKRIVDLDETVADLDESLTATCNIVSALIDRVNLLEKRLDDIIEKGKP